MWGGCAGICRHSTLTSVFAHVSTRDCPFHEELLLGSAAVKSDVGWVCGHVQLQRLHEGPQSAPANGQHMTAASRCGCQPHLINSNVEYYDDDNRWYNFSSS